MNKGWPRWTQARARSRGARASRGTRGRTAPPLTIDGHSLTIDGHGLTIDGHGLPIDG